MEVILTFEEFCGEEGEFSTDQGTAFASIFIQVRCFGAETSLRGSCWPTHTSHTPRYITVCVQYCTSPGTLHIAPYVERQRADLSRLPLQVLKQLYDTDILTEDALLAWADEKADAAAEDRRFLTLVRMPQCPQCMRESEALAPTWFVVAQHG